MNLITSAPYLMFWRTYHGIHAVGNAIAAVLELWRKIILVAVAPCDAKRGTGSKHARAGNVSRLDSVSQSEIRVSARADVAHGGEPRFQSHSRVARANQRRSRIGRVKSGWAERIGRHSQVRVAINQARKNGLV
jgi:hypothetical protein